MKTLIDFDGALVVAIPVQGGFGEPSPRECMLLEGPQGWGEFSPPPDATDQQAARWLTAAVEPGTVGWPDAVRGRVPVAVAVPALDPARARELVAQSGCRTAEVTVGDPGSVARLEAVRDALGADGRIRCVPSGRWDRSLLRSLMMAAGELEFVECATADEASALRREADVRVAVDVAGLPTAEWAGLRDHADVAVLSCAALGGVRRALRAAETTALPAAVRSGRETSVGLAGAAALAGALPELPFACTISRPSWVNADVTGDSRAAVAVAGHVPVAPMPPGPEPALVNALAVSDDSTVRWWRQRLARARSAL